MCRVWEENPPHRARCPQRSSGHSRRKRVTWDRWVQQPTCLSYPTVWLKTKPVVPPVVPPEPCRWNPPCRTSALPASPAPAMLGEMRKRCPHWRWKSQHLPQRSFSSLVMDMASLMVLFALLLVRVENDLFLTEKTVSWRCQDPPESPQAHFHDEMRGSYEKGTGSQLAWCSRSEQPSECPDPWVMSGFPGFLHF